LPEDLPGVTPGSGPRFHGYDAPAPTIDYARIYQQSRATFVDLVRGLRDTLRGIQVGDSSPYSKATQRDIALRDWEQTLAQARAGNSTAWQDLDRVTQTAIDAYRAYYGGGAGLDEFTRRAMEALTALGTDPAVEQRTVEDLMRRQLSEAATAYQQNHEDLQQVRIAIVDLMIASQGGYGVSNLVNGSARFAASTAVAPLVAAPAPILVYVPPSASAGNSDPEVATLLREILSKLGGRLEVQEVGAVKEDIAGIRTSSSKSAGHLEVIEEQGRSKRLAILRQAAGGA
jgi:hypothetical protein